MFRIRFLALLLALGCLAVPAAAAEVDCDSVYCFTPEDFGKDLSGICITGLPETGTVLLDTRVLQPGDILTAEQLAQMTFAPLQTQEDVQAVISFLPIYADRVEDSATMMERSVEPRNCLER